MKNAYKFFLVLTLVFVLGLSNYGMNKLNKMSDVALEEIEALALIEEDLGWWDRPDYNCVTVTCQCIFYSYTSNVAQYVGEGAGSVAHQWNCTGCGDCGWTM